jgi:hypothetical protein
LDCGNIWSLAINPVGTIFAGTAGYGTGVYRSTDNDVNSVVINPIGHILQAQSAGCSDQ